MNSLAQDTLEKQTPAVWYGCYDTGWGNNISPASYAHPAKMARGLAQRIYTYMLEQGWLKPGDTVLDPFGGIGGTCLDALANGLSWVGVELEARFVDLGQGCDCTGISKADWVRFYGRWDKANYKEGRHWCPDCLAQARQVTERRQLSLFEPEPSAAYTRNSGLIPETPPHHYRGNLELFRKYARPGTYAVLLQGDSRYLRQVIGQAGIDGLLSSPPYANGTVHGGVSVDRTKFDRKEGPNSQVHKMADYGQANGQLANLKEGDLDGLLSSPPFAGNTGGQGEASRNGIDAALFDRHSGGMKRGTGENPDNLDHLSMKGLAEALISSPPFGQAETRDRSTYQGGFVGDMMSRAYTQSKQGETEGNLAALPSGSFDAALSSPPFADSVGSDSPEKRGGLLKSDPRRASDRNLTGSYGATEGQLGAMKAEGLVSSPPYEASIHNQVHGIRDERRARNNSDIQQATYGISSGQLGTEQGQTFWSAARLIVSECFEALKPGAYSAWVCKAFIRDGQRVEFPDQWRQLCEACGFEFVEEIRAMLVTEKGVQVDLDGKDRRQKVERKSFFRRLHESRLAEDQAHLRIDWETVIIMRKPD